MIGFIGRVAASTALAQVARQFGREAMERIMAGEAIESVWLKGYYVVQEIAEKLNQKYYKLTDYPRLLMRHELLKI